MIKDDLLKKLLLHHKTAEVVLAVFVVTITLTIILSDLVPEHIRENMLIMWAMVIFFSLAVARGIACIILYLNPFKPGHMLGFFLSIVAFTALYLYADGHSAAIQDEDGNANHDFHIVETEIQLNITCDGNGVFRRHQLIVPFVELDSIIELDFYATGGLKNLSIDFCIEEIKPDNGRIKIPSEPVLPEDMMGCLVHRMKNGHKLMPGHLYARSTLVQANSSFVDSTSDALVIVINRPTNRLHATVQFDGDCYVDPDRLRLELIKEKGATLYQPKILSIPHKDSVYAKFSRYEPSVGDLISLTWEYIESPHINSALQSSAVEVDLDTSTFGGE